MKEDEKPAKQDPAVDDETEKCKPLKKRRRKRQIVESDDEETKKPVEAEKTEKEKTEKEKTEKEKPENAPLIRQAKVIAGEVIKQWQSSSRGRGGQSQN